jgi:hypothetical protein
MCRIAATGTAIVIVEQDVRRALEVSDYTCAGHRRVAFQGAAANIAADERIGLRISAPAAAERHILTGSSTICRHCCRWRRARRVAPLRANVATTKHRALPSADDSAFQEKQP